ncbi:MAG: 4Fe-4S dicluster domain-containing protein [Actinomycetota bacterium]|nr:4Fe-4S dicluster domain-containing protein [Actinomycetota bacterium]
MIKIIKNFFKNFGNVFSRPVTVNYPREKIIIPEGSKGMLHLRLDPDSLEIVCEACGQCEQACPQKCISIKRERDERGNLVLEEFYLDSGRCIFCGNCVEVCGRNSLEMSYRYQLAEYEREQLVVEKLDLVKQADFVIRDFWSK